MADNDIIKVLGSYTWAKLYHEEGKLPKLDLGEVLDLINRQKAEIEELQEELEETQEKLEALLCEATGGKLSKHSYTTEVMTTQAHEPLLKCCEDERAEAVKEFAEIFLKKVHDNHYMLSDRINSKDYGMFTIGIEQAVYETKKEMTKET